MHHTDTMFASGYKFAHELHELTFGPDELFEKVFQSENGIFLVVSESAGNMQEKAGCRILRPDDDWD